MQLLLFILNKEEHLEEILEMLKEHGSIDMHCEYCGSNYHFERDDLQILLNDSHNIQH